MDPRLAKLAPIDNGFFVLALHAKIEAFLRWKLGLVQDREAKFPGMLKSYFERRKAEGGRDPMHSLEDRLVAEHQRTNDVRHRYQELDETTAKYAAKNYIDFLVFSGQGSNPDVVDLGRLLQDWEKQAFVVLHSADHTNLVNELRQTRENWQSTITKYADLADLEVQRDELLGAVERATRMTSQLESRLKAKDSQNDEARKKLADQRRTSTQLEKDLAEKESQLLAYAQLRSYLDKTNLINNFARTRKAFEDQVLRLTPDQQAVVDELRLDRESLIKGSAGTGKSLVLLKLLERVLLPGSGGLGLETPTPSIRLFTYTHSLTKYSEYLASLLKLSPPPGTVVTADSFLNGLSREILSLSVVYDWADDPAIKALIAASGLKEKEFVLECEHLLWAWGHTWESYRDVDRRGFKVGLPQAERQRVWEAQEKVLAILEARKQVPSSVAASRLVQKSESWKDRQLDFVFLDEAQDLAPARLRFFRQVARHGFVLAADDGQILNQHRSPFAEAGLDVRGKRTRTLKTNFRNTRSIELAANAFYDGALTPSTYRDGPAPEYYFGDHTEPVLDQLFAKVRIFLEEFRYDPENILIIHSGTGSGLEERLTKEHLLWEAINSPSFRFDSTGKLRVSSFQSAKGLDFPVVLILWNRPTKPVGWDPVAVSRLQRNFMYVALTRAMEQVNVFVREDDTDVVATLRCEAKC